MKTLVIMFKDTKNYNNHPKDCLFVIVFFLVYLKNYTLYIDLIFKMSLSKKIKKKMLQSPLSFSPTTTTTGARKVI